MLNEVSFSHIKDLNRRLTALLDDPHPGLMSWCQEYATVMQTISDFWNRKEEDIEKDVG